MPTALANPVKVQLLVNLQALVAAGVLGSIISIDRSEDPLKTEPTNGYPLAIVGMPSTASDYEDQAFNKRTYAWHILFVVKPSELRNPDTDVEDLMDAVLNQFDNNFTLAGVSDASVLPAEIEPGGRPISTPSGDLLCFVVTLKVQKLYQWLNPNL
jgi:hypothetical protein